MGLLLFFWLVTSAACALFTAAAARGKGYNDSSWSVIGFVFGPLGLLAIAACPDLRSRRLLRMIAEGQSGAGDKLQAFDSPTPKYSGEGGMLGEMVESLLKTNRD
ncbi:hypothetical protein Syncc8109_2324 [Synechococcus sp. WH 8109]|uniref:hypothetical protein n=1 Tax=Synechococcus sp. WH 8109 TaxID=166314 RepID=UPI0003DFD09B|nr:hypothetical protein [Synechococcus sp. WH 8109]AHF64647.1 hypothetical protein Syncc8109_2324 [Synechococcus sp. WH 8109]